MSGSNEEHWRPARGQQNAPPQTPSRQNSQQQQQQQRRNVSREGGNAWQTSDRGNKDWPPSGPQEQHIHVKGGFNAQEIQQALKTAYSSGSRENDKPLKYKPPAGYAHSTKQGGPWGSKSNTMAGGKDFFLELRKQVSTLQQGLERAGG